MNLKTGHEKLSNLKQSEESFKKNEENSCDVRGSTELTYMCNWPLRRVEQQKYLKQQWLKF
jgi:hypothetical protein